MPRWPWRRRLRFGLPERLAVTESHFALSDRGRRRATNQDRAITKDLKGGYTLLVVADGVGGAAGGETASSETVATLLSSLEEEWIGDPERALLDAVTAANQRVRELAKADPKIGNMATTLVAALLAGREAWIVNIGDSRAYLSAYGTLTALTEDDSWVAEQLRSGALSEEEAARSPYQNVVTKGIGVEEHVTPEVIGRTLQPGETLLLCSDGLYRVVQPAEIVRTLEERPIRAAATRLVELANEAGGPDNISVALYRMSGGGNENTTVRAIIGGPV